MATRTDPTRRWPAVLAWAIALSVGALWPAVAIGLGALGSLAGPGPMDVIGPGLVLLCGGFLLALQPLTYALFRRSARGEMPEGPCVRSGSVVDRHWFEFAQAPGHRWWVGPEEAAAIRARPAAPLPTDGLELSFGHEPDLPLEAHRWAIGKNLFAWGVASLTWLLWPLGGFLIYLSRVPFQGGVDGMLGMGLAEMLVWAFAGLLLISLPAMVVQAVVVGPTLHGLWLLLHRLRSRDFSEQVSWNGSVLRTRESQLVVDDATEVELRYDLRGALLEAKDERQSLVIRGDHAQLAALRDLLQARQSVQSGGREELEQALEGVLAGRERQSVELGTGP